MLNRMLTQKEQFALLFVGAAAVFGGLALFFVRDEKPDPTPMQAVDAASPGIVETLPAPRQPAEIPAEPEVAPAPLGALTPSEIAVAVMGAVNRGGLFRVEPDMRVGELIDKAGGATENADLSDINLGAKLIDGTTLTVPTLPVPDEPGNRLSNLHTPVYTPNPPQYTRSYAAMHPVMTETAPATPNAPAPGNPGDLIDLNTAPQAELETLPGIGPAFAQRIISYRAQTPFTSVEQLDEVPGIGPKRLAELRPLVTVR